jgi:hypothetical protein
VTKAPELKTVHLQLPVSTQDLAALELGSVVYLTGRVYTAREGVYKRAVEDGAGLACAAREARARQFPLLPRRDNRLLPLRQVVRWLVQDLPLCSSDTSSFLLPSTRVL